MYRKIVLFTLGLAFIFGPSLSAPASEVTARIGKEAPKKLLFVGNSFSFYNNGIHNHLGSLIRTNSEWEAGVNRHKLLTYSGGHLFEQIISIAGIFKTDTHGFEAVILQGHSNEPIHKKKSNRFEEALNRSVSLIKDQNLEPILFMTWGYKNDRRMAERLVDAYIKQGKRHKIRVAPVGVAFQEAAKSLPEIDLYVADVAGFSEQGITFRAEVKHPSDAGTYLAACVFYAMLFNKSPEGTPFISQLSSTDALALQKLSWDVVQKFNKTYPYN